MPRKPGITHESRAKVLLALKRFQEQHPDGCTVTRLNQLLDWSSVDTQKVVDDLVASAMAYGDYLTPWVSTHPRKDHKLSKSGEYLIKVSPYGDEFLQHWDKLTELAASRDHYYSESY